MKRRTLLLASLCLSCTLSAPAQERDPRLRAPSKPPPTVSLPDLVVVGITFGDASAPSNVRVEVRNQGKAKSGECHLAFMSGKPSDTSTTAQRVWTVDVPAIEAGHGAFLRFKVEPLKESDGPWRATVDRSGVVKESDEGNNTLAYTAPAPAPPPATHLPDLYIYRFSLEDPYTGKVTVVVANKGVAHAAPSTLRLIVWEVGKFEQKEAKTVFVKVPEIAVGGKVTVNAVAGVPVMSTKFSLYVDISEEVAESNEKNNRAEGEAGKY